MKHEIKIFTVKVDPTDKSQFIDLENKIVFVMSKLNPELQVYNVEIVFVDPKHIRIRFYRPLKYEIGGGNNIADIDLAIVFGLDVESFRLDMSKPDPRDCNMAVAFGMTAWYNHWYGMLDVAEKLYKKWCCKGVKKVEITPTEDFVQMDIELI